MSFELCLLQAIALPAFLWSFTVCSGSFHFEGPTKLTGDVSQLLDVFPTCLAFHKYVEQCSESGYLMPFNILEFKGSAPIEIDHSGNIVSISLVDQQLDDSDIGDLSKLPTTLTRLTLTNNQFTKFNVNALPPGLEVLDLDHNLLANLDLTVLPPSLLTVMLNYNQLSTADFGHLPPRLETICITNNELNYMDLREMPPSLRYCDFSMNLLEDKHFNTLPMDGRRTVVVGKGNQKKN